MLDDEDLKGLFMSEEGVPEEYDESTRAIMRAIQSLDVEGVDNVMSRATTTTIDFSMGEAGELSVLQRAAGGSFGSSVVIDTTSNEVTSATLRYGSMDLPEGADLFLATVEVAKRVERANPPVRGFDPAETSDDLVVRFRDMSGMMGSLGSEGTDILHIVYNTRVPVDGFAEWLVRFTELYEEEKDDIREFTLEVGYDG